MSFDVKLRADQKRRSLRYLEDRILWPTRDSNFDTKNSVNNGGLPVQVRSARSSRLIKYEKKERTDNRAVHM